MGRGWVSTPANPLSMKKVSVTVVLAMAISMVQMAGGISGAAACAAMGTRVHAYHVETQWPKKVYRQSEKAVVKVTVTRPAHEDPAGLGVEFEPPTSVPEAGVNVATSLQTGIYPYPYAHAVTDANGQATLKLPLTDVPKKGTFDAQTLVWKIQNQGGAACSEIEEYGYKYDPRAVTVI